MVSTYQGWVADGKPFWQCRPALDLIAILQRYGYTGPKSGYPDERHQLADPPEDHCPYSHTPWPGPQPYPYCMAIDIMPDKGIDVVTLGYRLVTDKLNGIPGTEPIKYINWTDVAGQCWHDSWINGHARTPSTDRGHIHVSFRTDFAASSIMGRSLYDPLGGTMTDPNAVSYVKYDQDRLRATYDAAVRIEAAIATLRTDVANLTTIANATFNSLGTRFDRIDAHLAELPDLLLATGGLSRAELLGVIKEGVAATLRDGIGDVK
jgi:hypothetical protein